MSTHQANAQKPYGQRWHTHTPNTRGPRTHKSHALRLELVLAALSLGVSAALCVAADEAVGAARPPSADLEWWREARFGLFVHWGPVSLKGTEIGWSRGAQVPTEEYDRLYKKFDPQRFDADEWVSIAKAAGMKYLVITSKHHDGFSIWDSKQTEYDILSSPYSKDIMRALSEACRRGGIRFCFYHSICDWYHPDYPTGSPGGRTAKPQANMERYVKFLHEQLRELLTGYGPIGIVWFDGHWEKPWTVEMGEELYRYVRSLQPSVIVNNRVGKGRPGGPRPGDYDTPEQRVGSFNRDRPWETCMTICRQWAWKPDDQLKTLEQCLRILVSTAGGDGNLLLNVGPMPDGRIEPRQVERLKEMGAWLAKHGDGIYGTRGGPFKPGRWGASTCKGSTIYLFVLQWAADEPLRLPAIGRKILRAEATTGGSVDVRAEDGGITVEVAEGDRDPLVTVIRLTVEGDAFGIEPVDVPFSISKSLAYQKKATASNVYRSSGAYAAEKAIDDDPETRWATDAGTSAAWLAVDLGEPVSIDRVLVDERDWNRVQRFELQYRDGGAWKTIFAGTTLGADFTRKFPVLTARHVRLNILEATEGPTIWEFQLFGPK